MRGQVLAGLIVALMCAAPATAKTAVGEGAELSGTRSEQFLPYLQCVPYAREVSGVQLYGDAWTWWGQAEGRYERGFRPRVGAVMAFRPHGNMRLGHVAAVSRVIDSRNILIRHANWSPINGRRGQIEDNVRAVDVSENNDWSEVRVWFEPIGDLGGTRWPVSGFIYNRTPKRPDDGVRLARNSGAPMRHLRAAGGDHTSRDADPIGRIIAARSNSALALRD